MNIGTTPPALDEGGSPLKTASAAKTSATKACKVCGEQIPASAVKCNQCDNFQDQDFVHCTSCRELIPATAGKCVKCDSYQDWRRFFVFSSTVLALLTALVSVSTSAVPIFVAAIEGNRANIEIVSVKPSSGASIVALAWNDGNRPGGLVEAKLKLIKSTDVRLITLDNKTLQNVDGKNVALHTIEPGKGEFFLFEAPLLTEPTFRDDKINLSEYLCRFSFTTLERRRNKEPPVFEDKCQNFAWALNARVPPSPR